jgi:hypothetical protein
MQLILTQRETLKPADHRDTLLTDPERDNGMMLICISRAGDGSHLTLDL